MKNNERGAGLILTILLVTCFISVVYYNLANEKAIEIEQNYNNMQKNLINTQESYSNYYNY